MKKITLLTMLALGILSCQTKKSDVPVTKQTVAVEPIREILFVKQTAAIDRPIDDIDIGFRIFDCDTKESTSIHLETGTHIEIPPSAFEDEAGNIIKGKVQIKYREFHDVADIMLSGIKMNINEGDEIKDFESAGMFEIRAFKDEKKLDLRENKTVKVDLASFKSGEFNSYVFNEGTSEWNYIEQSKAKTNKRRAAELEELAESERTTEVICDEEPQEFKGDDIVFDLDYNLNHYGEMDMLAGALWKVSGGKVEEARFTAVKDNYQGMELEPVDTLCNTYKLELWNLKNDRSETDKVSFNVVPVWQGKQYEKVKKNFKEKVRAFRKSLKERMEARRMARQEAKLLRSFEISGMGIYNCDRVLDFLKLVPIAIAIKFKDQIKSWWYLTQNKEIAIKYYQPELKDFKYNSQSSNSVVAILPNGKIGTVSSTRFMNAYEEYEANPATDKTLELEFDQVTDPVKTRKTFKQIIQSLK